MLRVRTAINGWSGGPGLTTSYFVTPLQDAAAALRCVGYVRSALLASRAFITPTGVSFSPSGDVDVIDSATGNITDTLSVAGGAVIVGTDGASQAPPAIAGLLVLKTATFIAGRRVKGRVFVSPLSAASVASDGLLTNAAQSNLAGRFAAMAAALDAGDSWVVWHRPKLGVGGQACIITATSSPFKLAVLTSRRD